MATEGSTTRTVTVREESKTRDSVEMRQREIGENDGMRSTAFPVVQRPSSGIYDDGVPPAEPSKGHVQ